jgi:hypothetical protein
MLRHQEGAERVQHSASSTLLESSERMLHAEDALTSVA